MFFNDFNIEAIEKEISENPNNIKALSDMGQYYAYKGEYATSIRYYEKILRLNENNVRAWSAIGHCCSLKHDYLKCINAYHRSISIKDHKIDMQMWYGLAILYYNLEEWTHSEKIFQTILKIENDFSLRYDVYYKLGVMALKTKITEKAIRCLQKASEFDNAPSSNKIDIILMLIKARSGIDSWEEVLKKYEKALNIDSNNVRLIKSYAWELLSMRKYLECKNFLKNYLKQNKSLSEIQYILGRSYQALGKIGRARICYSYALSVYSNSYVYWTSTGVLYAEANQISDAFECFSKAIDAYKESWEAWNNTGMLYLMCNQKPEADLSFQKARSYNSPQNLPNSFVHPSVDILEPIFKQPIPDIKSNIGQEVYQQLDRLITKEIYKIIESIKLDTKKIEEKPPEIVVPKVANPKRTEVPESPSKNNDTKLNIPPMAFFQSLIMNPMMFYKIMSNSHLANKAQNKPKEENESDQVAKALICMTEDSLRKKRKNSADSEEPHKKLKDSSL